MTPINSNLKLTDIDLEESNVDKIFNVAYRDASYRQIVSKRIALEDFEGAAHTALKIKALASEEAAFHEILYRNNDPRAADAIEKIADEMTLSEDQYIPYLYVIRQRILSGDIKAAIQTALKINLLSIQNFALFEISEKCTDLQDMETIASAVNNWEDQDRIYQVMIGKMMASSDVDGAIRTALKIHSLVAQNNALFDILSQSQDLQVAESLVGKMHFYSTIHKAYETLIEKHTSGGNVEEASRLRGKITELNQDQHDVIAAVANVIVGGAFLTFTCVTIASVFFILSQDIQDIQDIWHCS
jgi:hypothetical protein